MQPGPFNYPDVKQAAKTRNFGENPALSRGCRYPRQDYVTRRLRHRADRGTVDLPILYRRLVNSPGAMRNGKMTRGSKSRYEIRSLALARAETLVAK